MINLLCDSLGDLENAISHLEQYVEVTEKDGMQSQLARACSAIGQMSNSLVSSVNIMNCVNVCNIRVIMNELWSILVDVISCVCNWMINKHYIHHVFSMELLKDIISPVTSHNLSVTQL